jgi:hypothetical protein
LFARGFATSRLAGSLLSTGHLLRVWESETGMCGGDKSGMEIGKRGRSDVYTLVGVRRDQQVNKNK